LEFQVADRPSFDVPLANVSQAIAGKNEAVLEFHQNDDCAVGLMEIRFHMAPDGQENDNNEERIQVCRISWPVYNVAFMLQEFLDSVNQYAGVIKDLDKPIATLEQIMANPPRGRYDIKVFGSHMSFHGKTFDVYFCFHTKTVAKCSLWYVLILSNHKQLILTDWTRSADSSGSNTLSLCCVGVQ
jgi:structure-specific recognition protein 1